MAEYVDRAILKEEIAQLISRTLKEGKDQYAIGLVLAYDIVGNASKADIDEAKHGKWTLNKDGSGTCSECGHIQYNCWDLDNADNFCHFCGADMRESYGK